MGDEGKMRIRVPGRSEGDGMESVLNTPVQEMSKDWLPSACYHGRPRTKAREPKFVPYEPYKAAVSPLLFPCTTNTESNSLVDSDKVNSLASSIIKLYSDLEGRTQIGEGKDHCCSQLLALEEKIAELERENKELQSQYQVQIEVNSDLKRMLVASLGEDIQSKVQFMTEDKAALGKEVLRLSEEEERLAVQCDVMESKFKASSVMVKELVQWKNSLSHSLAQSHNNIEELLHEHRVLFGNMCIALSNLESVATAFDPGAQPSPKKKLTPINLVHLSVELKSLSNTIRDRLLGKSSRVDQQQKYVYQLTQAESRASQLLQNRQRSDLFSMSAEEEKPNPGVIACHFLPHTCEGNTPAATFCKHCSGRVKNL